MNRYAGNTEGDEDSSSVTCLAACYRQHVGMDGEAAGFYLGAFFLGAFFFFHDRILSSETTCKIEINVLFNFRKVGFVELKVRVRHNANQCPETGHWLVCSLILVPQ